MLSFIEKYAGIPRIDIKIDNLSGGKEYKEEAVKAIGLALYGIIEDIVDHGIEPDDMQEVEIRHRPDGMTGKIRDIALLCIIHQLLGHAAKLMLDPLINARLLPTQHASIPGRGQTLLKDQVRRYLLKEGLGIQYIRKTDVVHAYANTQYSVCTEIVRKEIPNARYAIGLLEYLGSIAPGGHLIIGGYLDAWLFNFLMSYAIRHLYTLGSVRRGKKIPHIIRCATFMDDFALAASSIKGEVRAVKSLNSWMKKQQGLELKETTGIMKPLTVEEEQRRKVLPKPSQRGVPMLDMAGYRVSRTHVTIRRRVFRRARRQFLRAYTEMKKTGTIRRDRAQKIISYYSYVAQSDSYKMSRTYHIKELMKMAHRINSFYGWLEARRKEGELNVLRERRSRQQAGKSEDRIPAGWKEINTYDGPCGGITAGGCGGEEDLPF